MKKGVFTIILMVMTLYGFSQEMTIRAQFIPFDQTLEEHSIAFGIEYTKAQIGYLFFMNRASLSLRTVGYYTAINYKVGIRSYFRNHQKTYFSVLFADKYLNTELKNKLGRYGRIHTQYYGQGLELAIGRKFQYKKVGLDFNLGCFAAYQNKVQGKELLGVRDSNGRAIIIANKAPYFGVLPSIELVFFYQFSLKP